MRHYAAAIGDTVCQGLLGVHVLARFRSGDGDGRVPMVRRADADRVDVVAFEYGAKIAIDFAAFVLAALHELAVGFVDHVACFTRVLIVHVAYANNLRVALSKKRA